MPLLRRQLFWPVVIALVIYYLRTLSFTPLELIRYLGGLFILWLPLTFIIAALLKNSLKDRLIRIILSILVSYGLTTLVYFLQAIYVSDSIVLLLVILYVAAGLVLLLETRRSHFRLAGLRSQIKLDRTLTLLIVLSLIVNIPYKSAWQTTPKGEQVYVLFNETLYYSALVAELDRGIPPTQAPSRAGTPDRAYHLFPHLTTLMVARVSQQSDFLRTIYVYQYSLLDILTCLALYAIGKTLTRRVGGGYVLILAMFSLTIPAVGLFRWDQVFYPFTIWSHTSNLNYVMYFAPHFYSTIPALFAFILAVLLVSQRFFDNASTFALLLVAGLLLGTLLRFRASIYLSLAPPFCLMLAFMWLRRRRREYLYIFGVLLVISLILYVETLSSVYFPGSSKVYIGFNSFTQWDNPGAYVNTWPGARTVYRVLTTLVGANESLLDWSWQVISMTCFILFNSIGLPMLVLGIHFVTRAKNDKEWSLWLFFLVISTLICIGSAILLTTTYDAYSLASQLGLIPYWLFFILLPIGVLSVCEHLRERWRFVVARVVIILGILLIGAHLTLPRLFNLLAGTQYVLSSDRLLALQYIRENTPETAVLFINPRTDVPEFLHSGLTGRRVYLEGSILTNPLETILAAQSSNEDRLLTSGYLWNTRAVESFCEVIRQINVDYLVEYQQEPLRIAPYQDCLTQLWVSPHNQVTIWGIQR